MEAPSAPPPILLPGIALPPCRQEIRSVTAILLWGQARHPQCQGQAFLLAVFCGEIRRVKGLSFYCGRSVATRSPFPSTQG